MVFNGNVATVPGSDAGMKKKSQRQLKETKMETIRQGIRTDTEVGLLLTEGDKLVGDVSKCYELLREANAELFEFRRSGIRIADDRVLELEAEVAFEVRADTLLKNTDQRKDAMAKRLKEYPKWNIAIDALRKAKRTEHQISQEVFKCEYDVKIARRYLDVWHSRMAVIAGLSNEQQEHRHHLIASANVIIGGTHDKETE